MATATISPPTPQEVHAAALKSGAVTILTLLDNLQWLKGGADWTAWRAFLCAVYGLPMTEREFDIFRHCTGRKTAPTKQAREVWVPVGRRGRKSAIAALMGVYHAAYRDHAPYLAPGERATIPILAKNKAEARQIRDYAMEILRAPALAHLVTGAQSEEIALSTRVDLRIKAASLTAGRSKTAPLALLDEIAFFHDDTSAVPDEEIVNGIRPAMATIPGALLAAMSSPYARRGILWKNYDQHYGVDEDPILIWQADTEAMHDTPQIRVFVAEQYARDPVSARAEYGAQFRTDIEAFVPIEVVRACTAPGITVRLPRPGVQYFAHVDPSGGTSDSMTLGIGHWDPSEERAVQDYLGEWQPKATEDVKAAVLKPSDVVTDMVDVLRRYGIRSVQGDYYGGEWPGDLFRKGVHAPLCARRRNDFLACDCDDVWKVGYEVSPDPKSDIYREFLPLLNGQHVLMLDLPKMHRQFTDLDRKVARGGHDSIDHSPGQHDDLANVTAGVLRRASKLKPKVRHVEKPAETALEIERRRRNAWVKQVIAGADRKHHGGVPGL